MSINNLPQEAQDEIYKNLTIEDLSNLMLTEKSKIYETKYIFNYKKVIDIINILQYCHSYFDDNKNYISKSLIEDDPSDFARYLLTLGLTKNEILDEDDDYYDEDVDLNEYLDSSTILKKDIIKYYVGIINKKLHKPIEFNIKAQYGLNTLYFEPSELLYKLIYRIRYGFNGHITNIKYEKYIKDEDLYEIRVFMDFEDYV